MTLPEAMVLQDSAITDMMHNERETWLDLAAEIPMRL